MSRQNELISRYGVIESIPSERMVSVDPLLTLNNNQPVAANHVEILSGGPSVQFVDVLPNRRVRIVNIGPSEVENVLYKAMYQHSEQEDPNDDQVEAYEDEGPFPAPWSLGKNFQDVYVIGSVDSGDTIYDCDYLHENGVTDGIQAAIAAAIADGRPGKFIIRSGTYLRQSETAFPQGSLVQGEGRSNTIISGTAGARILNQDSADVVFLDVGFVSLAETVDANVVRVVANNVQFHRCLISGGDYQAGVADSVLRLASTATKLFDCVVGFTGVARSAAIRCEAGVENLSLIDCQVISSPDGLVGEDLDVLRIFSSFFSCSEVNVYFETLTHDRFDECVFEVSGQENSKGVVVEGVCSNSVFHECYFMPVAGEEASAGSDFLYLVPVNPLDSSAVVEVSNCKFLFCSGGVPVQIWNVDILRLSENTIENYGTNQVALSMGNISNALLEENKAIGDVIIDDCSYSQIESNEIVSVAGEITGSALSLTTQAFNVEIKNNVIYQESVLAGSTSNGISLSGTNGQINIEENLLYSNEANNTSIAIACFNCSLSSIRNNTTFSYVDSIQYSSANANDLVDISSNQIFSGTNGITLLHRGTSKINDNQFNTLLGDAVIVTITANEASINFCNNQCKDITGQFMTMDAQELIINAVISNNNGKGIGGNGLNVVQIVANSLISCTGNVLKASAAVGTGIILSGAAGTCSFGANLTSGFAATWSIVGLTCLPPDGAAAAGVQTQDINA